MADLYIRVKVGLPDSDGARVLERRLEVERAWSFAVSMWDWFVDKHPEGQVVGPDAAFLIARGAGWTGDADRFCAAMVAAEYLAPITEGFRVRGWRDWAGFHLEVRAAAKGRKQAERDRKSKGRHADVAVTSHGQASGKGSSEPSGHTDVARTPSPISVFRSSSASEGVQGESAPPPVDAQRPGEAAPTTAARESGHESERAGAGAGSTGTAPAPARPRARASDVEEFPFIAAVQSACWGRGFEAEFPKSRVAAKRLDHAIQAVTIPVAVERLMAMVTAARAKGGEPKPWLGWHQGVVQPEGEGEGETKTVIAKASDHTEFKKGQVFP